MGSVELIRIPALESISDSDWAKLEAVSPAIARYHLLLKRKPENSRDEMRTERHKKWLEAAAATLLKTSSPRDICEAWSEAADGILKQAWKNAGLESSSLTLFALGKLGSQELNLSSDVDLLLISKHPPDQDLLQKVRELTLSLSTVTDFGIALRVDFDLRPGGRFGPTISSLSQAEDYYWTQGATWERLALVRLRYICGNEDVRDGFTEMARQFSFRRHIDFSLLEDMKTLRSQIHALNSAQMSSMNLKLGAGGIRDIELFAHSLLILHGGRRHDLITHRTDDLYDRLIAAGVFDKTQLTELKNLYWTYRQIENEVQAENDEQTHILNFTDKNEALRLEVAAWSKQVDGIVADLLGPTRETRTSLYDLNQQRVWLASLGFSDSIQNEVWPALLNLTAQSTRSEFDENMRREFLFLFVENLAQLGVDRDLGLQIMLDFLKATRAKASLYSLFVSSPRVIKDLARLFSVSPYLGQILTSRPELIDSFLYGTLPAPPKETEALLEFLTEKKLLAEIYASLEMFDQPSSETTGRHLSQIADETVNLLMAHLREEYGSKPIGILALGKWGGSELGLRSDLDFIFICDETPDTDEHRVAKRFISRLTEPHKGGMIYQIDLRLRPSGKAGPIMVTRAQLLDYIRNSAAAWERQSYLRARLTHFDKEFNEQVHLACLERGISPEDKLELIQIREQLIKPNSGGYNLKYSHGGLLEIEFAAQIFCLSHQLLPSGSSTSDLFWSIEKSHKEVRDLTQNLTAAYRFLRQAEQFLTLVSGSSTHNLVRGSETSFRLAQIMKTDESSLCDRIEATLSNASTWVKQLDPIFSPS